MYSGCGDHGRTFQKALQQLLLYKKSKTGFSRPAVKLTSIDINPRSIPTLLIDARGLDSNAISAMRAAAPNMQVLIRMPCSETYACMNKHNRPCITVPGGTACLTPVPELQRGQHNGHTRPRGSGRTGERNQEHARGFGSCLHDYGEPVNRVLARSNGKSSGVHNVLTVNNLIQTYIHTGH